MLLPGRHARPGPPHPRRRREDRPRSRRRAGRPHARLPAGRRAGPRRGGPGRLRGRGADGGRRDEDNRIGCNSLSTRPPGPGPRIVGWTTGGGRKAQLVDSSLIFREVFALTVVVFLLAA